MPRPSWSSWQPREQTQHPQLLFLPAFLARPLFRSIQRGSCMTRGKRIYVLDTNVLMHDPTSLFRFEEHDVFIPMTVLEELDAAKKGQSEVSRNARQVSRFINELIENDKSRKIEEGLDLQLPQGLRLDRNAKVGRLHFQNQ